MTTRIQSLWRTMKSSTRTVIRVSVLESDPVRFLGLRTIFASQPDIQIHTGTVASVLAGPEDELILMTANRGPAFYAGMSALKGGAGRKSASS